MTQIMISCVAMSWDFVACRGMSWSDRRPHVEHHQAHCEKMTQRMISCVVMSWHVVACRRMSWNEVACRGTSHLGIRTAHPIHRPHGDILIPKINLYPQTPDRPQRAVTRSATSQILELPRKTMWWQAVKSNLPVAQNAPFHATD